MSVTAKQRVVLEAVANHPRGVTVRQLADELEVPTARSARYSYDEVYGQLRTLRRKGYVAPTNADRRPLLFMQTVAGRDALIG